MGLGIQGSVVIAGYGVIRKSWEFKTSYGGGIVSIVC